MHDAIGRTCQTRVAIAAGRTEPHGVTLVPIGIFGQHTVGELIVHTLVQQGIGMGEVAEMGLCLSQQEVEVVAAEGGDGGLNLENLEIVEILVVTGAEVVTVVILRHTTLATQCVHHPLLREATDIVLIVESHAIVGGLQVERFLIGIFGAEILYETVALVVVVVVHDGTDELVHRARCRGIEDVGVGSVVVALHEQGELEDGDIADVGFAIHTLGTFGTSLVFVHILQQVVVNPLPVTLGCSLINIAGAPGAELGVEHHCGRGEIFPLAIEAYILVFGVEPLIPTHLQIGIDMDAVDGHAILQQVDGLVGQLLHVASGEDLGVAQGHFLGERIVKPIGLSVDFTQHQVGPCLDAYGGTDECGEVLLGNLGHAAHRAVILLHLGEIVVACHDDGVVAGGVGVGVAVGFIVVVDSLEFGGGIVGGLQQGGTRVGEEDGVVASLLHTVEDAEEALVHLVLFGDIVFLIDGILGVGIEEIVTRLHSKTHGEQAGGPNLIAYFHI